MLSAPVVLRAVAEPQKYSNSLTGFEVKYPSDWKVTEESHSGGVWKVGFSSPGVRDYDVVEHSGVAVCSKPKTSQFSLIRSCRRSDDHLSADWKHQVISDHKVIINGMTFRRIETQSGSITKSPRGQTNYAFVSTDSRDYMFIGFMNFGFGLAKYRPVFDEILKSFRPVRIPKLNSYENTKEGVSLIYPDSWTRCLNSVSTMEEMILLKIVPGRYWNCDGNNSIEIVKITKRLDSDSLDGAITSLPDENIRFLMNLSPGQSIERRGSVLGSVKATSSNGISKTHFHFWPRIKGKFVSLRLIETFPKESDTQMKAREEILSSLKVIFN